VVLVADDQDDGLDPLLGEFLLDPVETGGGDPGDLFAAPDREVYGDLHEVGGVLVRLGTTLSMAQSISEKRIAGLSDGIRLRTPLRKIRKRTRISPQLSARRAVMSMVSVMG
jgi:hypothetical protein